ncbi:hypothetical protein [Xylella fastidiosa]|uniref:hypothetical protein n=1 Tax=Xylella fastidiosa TaxID=2371 RepID=UPI001F2993FB|nr:hypothetical protein [Xylella fastidiosa]
MQCAIYSLVSARDPNSASKESAHSDTVPLISSLVCSCGVARSEKKRQEKRNAARAALEAAKKEACAAYDAAKDQEARDAAFAAARAALATYEAAESMGVAA